MSCFAVFLAGAIRDTPLLRAAIAGRRVIAADRGIRHAKTLGVDPELWVGDFDSAGADLESHFARVPRVVFPPDKDRTDGELAIEAALARGARDILLVGALGGPRSDHAFAHLVLALRYAGPDLRIALFDGRERAIPLSPGETVCDAEPGAAFSILKFSALEGLSIRGARWPLEAVTVPFDSILTQSNAATGPVTVVLRRGRALLLIQASAATD